MTSDDIQKRIDHIEVIYKEAMDALNRSRAEQFRIIDEYMAKIKEKRLEDLREIIQDRKY